MSNIIPPLPFTLANGSTADASQVMADLNQIRDSVNLLSTVSPILQVQYSGLSADGTVFVLPARAMVLFIMVQNTGAVETSSHFQVDFAQLSSFNLNGSNTLIAGATSLDYTNNLGNSNSGFFGGYTTATNFVLHNSGWNGTTATLTVCYIQL